MSRGDGRAARDHLQETVRLVRKNDLTRFHFNAMVEIAWNDMSEADAFAYLKTQGVSLDTPSPSPESPADAPSGRVGLMDGVRPD